MKKNLSTLLLPLFLSACVLDRPPVSVNVPDNNKAYQVDYLFEHDGCRVYRFQDKGNYVYFTNCQGEAIKMTDSTATRNTIKVKN